jgi:hypothetical protein
LPAPTRAQLIELLADRYGVTVTDEDHLDWALIAALDELSETTGYRPFIAGANSNHTYRAERGALRFANGATGTVTVSKDGAQLTDGQHFRLLPRNSERVEGLEWLGLPATIVVNAAWGYGSDYPPAIWQAILEHAAGRVLSGLRIGKLAQVGDSWTDGDVSVRNGSVLTGREGLAAIAGGQLIEEALATWQRNSRSAVWG